TRIVSTYTYISDHSQALHSLPTRRSSDLMQTGKTNVWLPIKADTFNQASSIKLKTNIENLEDIGLSVINDLKVKKYDMISDVEKGTNDEKKVGFIAEYSESISNKEHDAIDLYKVTSYSVKAIQELSDELNDLKEKLNER